MQARRLVDESSLETDSSAQQPTLRVVIAYQDLVAGLRAMRLLNKVCRQSGATINFEPRPWPFELLADADWGRAAAREVTGADLLIIAMRNSHPILPTVMQWVHATLAQPPGNLAAVVALFDPEAALEPAVIARFEVLEMAARNAGIAYFAPSPQRENEAAFEGLRQCAARVPPTSSRLADRHPSASPRSFTLQSL